MKKIIAIIGLKGLAIGMLAIACWLSVSGQQEATGYTVICGRIDAAALGRGKAPELRISEDSRSPDVFFNYRSYPLKLENDSFYVRFQTERPVVYLWFNDVDIREICDPGLYLIECGDSIHFRVDNDKYLRIDRRNALFDFQRSLYRLRSPIRNLLPKQEVSPVEGFRYVCSALPIYLSGRDSVMQHYRGQVDPAMYRLVVRNYRDAVWQNVLTSLKLLYLKNLGQEDARELLLYFETLMAGMDIEHEKELIDGGLLHVTTILKANEIRASLMAKANGLDGDPLSDTYALIRQHYTGYLRERALVSLLGNTEGPPGNADKLYGDAQALVSDPALAEELRDIASRRGKGLPVPDFSLQAIDGSTVHLADFRGKVVVAHFWYTGCGPCAEMVNNTGELFHRMTDNSDVVFLNVNVSASEKLWKDGIQSGLYHHPNERLLYTAGAGISHPLVRHFGYMSFPQLLVIDAAGRLVDSQPPMGRTAEEIESLENMIIESLGEKADR